MVNVPENRIRAIGAVLNNETRPLKERFRALFTLRNIGGPVSIDCIKECFKDTSVLLKHELAYCLGQMQDTNAKSVLVEVLEDTKQEPMVRHEAAEALGAIGSLDSRPVLEKYLKDPAVEVAETCELALERIWWLDNKHSNDENLSENPYFSIDPAPPATISDIPELRSILLNGEKTLFERYRAMFALRNIRTKEAVEALGAALKFGSALFKHEVAFVLGQLQDEITVPYLKETLEDASENEMVRHECAEALGAIANEDCLSILNKYLSDNKRVVRESCEVALDVCEYENSPEFQYANTLQTAA